MCCRCIVGQLDQRTPALRIRLHCNETITPRSIIRTRTADYSVQELLQSLEGAHGMLCDAAVG